jgi:hypothetical protein
MNIVVDTNILLKDLKFNGSHFRELFEFLKRTDSCLLVPSVVRLELLERFREIVRKEIERARSCWKRAADISSADYPPLPNIDIDAEVELLDQRLKKPAKGVRESIFLEASSIDVNELLSRGVQRRKPSDANGEQLRDVAVWLSVIEYAKKNRAEFGFLTEDSDFRTDKQSLEMHPELLAELAEHKLAVSFHTTIAQFLTNHALEQRLLESAWWIAQVPTADVGAAVKIVVPTSKQIRGILTEIELTSIELVSGIRYRVSAHSEYIEANYGVNAVLMISDPPGIISATFGLPTIFNQPANPISFALPRSPFQANFLNYATQGWTLPDITDMQVVQKNEPERYKCQISVDVAARFENQGRVVWEIDDLVIHTLEDS